MRLTPLLIALLLLSATELEAQWISNDSAFIAFKKIKGWWMTEDGKSDFGEKWDKQNDAGDSLYCKGFTVKNGMDTAYTENIIVTKDKNGVYYMPQVKGQKPVKFKLTRFENNTFEFTNFSHDYPKRISYYFKSKFYIIAYIDDGSENSKKRKYYYYRRIK